MKRSLKSRHANRRKRPPQARHQILDRHKAESSIAGIGFVRDRHRPDIWRDAKGKVLHMSRVGGGHWDLSRGQTHRIIQELKGAGYDVRIRRNDLILRA